LINFNEPETKKFVALLPYSLTDDQKKTAWEIIKDLGRKRPMNRLLQGDVGSGKTVVAALAMLNVGLAGKRTVLMAPTEILAIQHYQSLRKLFAQTGFKIALITSAQREIDGQPLTKKGLNNRLEAEAVEIIVGTHAVIQEKITIKNLGLVIVDEQHRFGVRQRKHLLRREANQEMPHFLSMTATPIPRTLALALYSDLDLSSIRHLPAGRKKIFTKLINEEKRSRAYEFIREKIKLGQQAFVICPLIDPSDSSGAKSVTEEFQRLKRDVFPDLRLVMLHGKMKSEEKKAVMRAFKNQKFDLLISTSVIEVGVDIPNATIVVIEGAERFGLAQLHQFRGRVGRGIEQSYCFLMPSNENPVTMQRLQALVDCHDGFTLAEKDMEWRGAGEVFGTRQSGLPESGLLDLSDFDIIKKAQQSAIKFWQDFRLEDYPLLQEKYTQKNIIWHFE
jgi:ATP-dependent DNA helicase RecG